MDSKRPLVIALTILNALCGIALTIATILAWDRLPFLGACFLIPYFTALWTIKVFPQAYLPPADKAKQTLKVRIGIAIGLLIAVALSRVPEPGKAWCHVLAGWLWVCIVVAEMWKGYARPTAIQAPPIQQR